MFFPRFWAFVFLELRQRFFDLQTDFYGDAKFEHFIIKCILDARTNFSSSWTFSVFLKELEKDVIDMLEKWF